MTIKFPSAPLLLLGRERNLGDIDQFFNRNNHMVITGMGGIGKTALCRSYYSTAESNELYEHFGWIDIQQGIIPDFVSQFDIGIINDDRVEIRFAKLCRILKDEFKNKTLLVIDNLNDPDDPGIQYLRALPLKILVTSRSQIFGFESYNLNFLDDEECRALFTYHYRSSIDNDMALVEVFERTGRHTLLIELLANIARIEFWTIAELLSKLKKDGFYFCAEDQMGIRSDYAHGQKLTLEEMIKRLIILSNLSADEKRFLRFFALFAPIPITIFMLKKIIVRESWRVLDDLKEKAWLQGDEDQRFQMHPLIRDVIRKNVTLEYDDCIESIIRITTIVQDIKFDCIIANRDEISHAVSILEEFEETDRFEIVLLTSIISKHLLHLGLFNDSLRWLQKLVTAFENEFPRDYRNLAVSYHNVARIYTEMGKFYESLSWQEKAKTILETELPGNHRELAATYINMAGNYIDLDLLDEAEYYHERAFTFLKKSLSLGCVDWAELYNGMATVYRLKGKYPEALYWQEKVVGILEQQDGGHPLLGHAYGTMAEIHRLLKNFSEALRWQECAVITEEKTLHNIHPDLAENYDHMALIYSDMNKLTDAQFWQEKSIEIAIKTWTDDHPKLARIFNNMAGICFRMGKLSAALNWQQKAIAIEEKTLPEGHQNIVASYNNMVAYCGELGMNDETIKWLEKVVKFIPVNDPRLPLFYEKLSFLYFQKKNLIGSLRWQEKAVEIYKKERSKDHFSLAVSFNMVSVIYRRMGEPTEALAWQKEALAINEKYLAKNHPDLAASYNNMALIYGDMGKLAIALNWQKKAVIILEKVLNEEDLDLAKAYTNMSEIYQLMKNFQQALTWQRKAVAIYEKILPQKHTDLLASYSRMSAIYQCLGKIDKSLKWKGKTM